MLKKNYLLLFVISLGGLWGYFAQKFDFGMLGTAIQVIFTASILYLVFDIIKESKKTSREPVGHGLSNNNKWKFLGNIAIAFLVLILLILLSAHTLELKETKDIMAVLNFFTCLLCGFLYYKETKK
jgi:hypothetical protein